MFIFNRQLHELFKEVQRNPLETQGRAALRNLIETALVSFEQWVPSETLTFGTTPEKRSRRLNFLKHLLLNGYLPPRIEYDSEVDWQPPKVNLAVIPNYFYSNALSLLEASLQRTDVAVFVVQAYADPSTPWLEMLPGGGAQLHAALTLEAGSLVWRRFTKPIPIHYIFPVDNYYKNKFQLVAEYADCGLPMPGSALIREVCEDKQQLRAIVQDIDGLCLPHECSISRADLARNRAQTLDEFCNEYGLHDLVTKPVDGFGGHGVRFWTYPHDRETLLAHLETALINSPAIIIQERIRMMSTRSGQDWNIRQYVVRSGKEAIRAAWKRVRIGEGVINTEQGAQSILVQDLLPQLDLSTEQSSAFKAAVDRTDQLAVAVMAHLTNYMVQKFRAHEQPYHGSGSNLEPDLLGLDFMIAADPQHPTGFAVYLLEINDFASGGMRDYEVLIHRQLQPQADRICAGHSLSLASAILDMATWRGQSVLRQTGLM